jgi:hypothetical protein
MDFLAAAVKDGATDASLGGSNQSTLLRRSYSQAGRRGFDPRLPLHVFNYLGMFHVLRSK